ncbi:MAG: hypothetical protein ACRC5H_08245, partial [Treponemataceae bacterium]
KGSFVTSDENHDAPSNGFIGVRVLEDSFIIEDGLASGWKFINMQLQFSYDVIAKEFFLSNYIVEIIDRREPDKSEIISQNVTQKIFFTDCALGKIDSLIFQ